MKTSIRSSAAAMALIASAGLMAAPVSAQGHDNYKNVEVAFVLDTTGSMSGLIEGAKRKIWSIANEIMDVNDDDQTSVSFALIGYRDRGDQYVTRTYDMTDDIHGIYGHLLDFRAQGGGDHPESVNQALYEAVYDLEWSRSSDTLKIVFLVGDAPPHMDYANDIRYPQTIRKANRKNIIINTVQAGSNYDTTRIWRKMADMGQGSYVSIPQDGGMQVIHTPYDDQIEQYQHRINKTSLGYGSQREQAEVKDKMDRISSAPSAVASDMAEYRMKAGKKNQVLTGANELIEDYEDGKIKLDELSETELPKSLRDLDAPARQAKVDSLVAERQKLNKNLEDLVAKREAFVEAEQKKRKEAGEADGFDKEVEIIVTGQMKKK